MVSLRSNGIVISIDTQTPAEDLVLIQQALIEALRAQYRNEANAEAITVNGETLTGNYYLLTLLESILPMAGDLRDGFGTKG